METSILKIITEYGVFAVLFFFTLCYLMKQSETQRKSAQAREDKLMEHIRKSDETQMVIADNVKEVSKNMVDMQQSIACMKTTMEYMQRDIDDLRDK